VEDAKGREIGWRRYLHRHPEVSFHKEQTARFVRETLESFEGLEKSA
jgi:metal-dependent amidase/aminoacylase/carboxypeptidase family protein